MSVLLESGMTGSTEKKIRLFIDSCAWNIFFEHNVSLHKELPADEFEVLMTKEVGAFEVVSIPERKEDLKNYIQQQIDERGIAIDSIFGFSSYNDPPGYRHRTGGFNEGRFVDYEELAFIEKFKVQPGKERKTGLYNDEADASLAARSCVGGVVLTAEDRDKPGPLKEAFQIGGKIVYLSEFNPAVTSLKSFILDNISQD
jgi:hypothetical protein